MDKKEVKVADQVMVMRHAEPYVGVVWQKQTKTCNVFVRSLRRSLRVPYYNLSLMNSTEKRYITDLPLDKPEWGYTHLRIIEGMARKILEEHALHQWSFQFDWSQKRAGMCNLGLQVISISVRLCMKEKLAEVRNTILHEVAHAIVGPRHHHDAVWYDTAMRIGCSASRTHSYTFAEPKYIIVCPNYHWVQTGQKKMRHRVCKQCRAAVSYEAYDEQRYHALQVMCE